MKLAIALIGSLFGLVFFSPFSLLGTLARLAHTSFVLGWMAPQRWSEILGEHVINKRVEAELKAMRDALAKDDASKS